MLTHRGKHTNKTHTHLVCQADTTTQHLFSHGHYWSHLTTSEMDSCCWEPEVPAITEPSHPFTCRSMGRLLKWPLEQCVIRPRRFNRFGRAPALPSLTWERLCLIRAVLSHPGCLFGRWARQDRDPDQWVVLKFYGGAGRGFCWLVFFTTTLWLTGRTETKVTLWISNGSAWTLPSSLLIKLSHFFFFF